MTDAERARAFLRALIIGTEKKPVTITIKEIEKK